MNKNRWKTVGLWGIALGWCIGLALQKLSTFDVFDLSEWYFYVLAFLFGLVQYGCILLTRHYNPRLLKGMGLIYGYIFLVQLVFLIKNWVHNGKPDILWFFDLGLIMVGLVLCLFCRVSGKQEQPSPAGTLREVLLIALMLIQHVFLITGGRFILLCMLAQVWIVDGRYTKRIYAVFYWLFAGLTGALSIFLLCNGKFIIVEIPCLIFDFLMAICCTKPSFIKSVDTNM